jgi:hypothetical protein
MLGNTSLTSQSIGNQSILSNIHQKSRLNQPLFSAEDAKPKYTKDMQDKADTFLRSTTGERASGNFTDDLHKIFVAQARTRADHARVPSLLEKLGLNLPKSK